jgi:plastocyanin
MRFPVRWLVAPALAGVLVGGGLILSARDRGEVHAQPAPQARVVIHDNNGQFMPPGEPSVGRWGYAPAHLDITQGESIIFDNPAGNFRPHTVTSITWSGMPAMRELTSGALYDSGNFMPGNSYTLDTSSMMPGQYTYYCALHPWMVGTITVSAP